MTKRFQVEAGRQYTYSWAPSRASVDLVVAIEAGARVYVDGDSKGEVPSGGPLKVADVLPGTHEVHVRKSGYVDVKETRRLETGAPVTVTARLTLAPSSAEFSDDFGGYTSQWVVPRPGSGSRRSSLRSPARPCPSS